ncbi:MAG TPA: TetR/AcrR family transcriptional regulator [Mycobacterium sp.]|nr:TetR/AcrR family transcriptional regulator [Mycobacterium sp.]
MSASSVIGRRRRAVRGAGDQLRDEILDAATELLLETGHAKAVSIRLVAQRVGVTPPSIYLHFADKDALMDAVCARYFENLDEEMARAAVGCATQLEVLRAKGLAYVRFALQTPELYRIATMGEGRAGSDVDVTLASSAFMHMRDAVAVMMGEGIYPPGDTTQVALELWSAAHGVVALLIAKPYLPWGDAEAFADRVLRAVCCGQIASGIIGYDTCPHDTIERLMQLKGKRADA